MHLYGFGFMGFRGFTREPVRIAPLKTINLIAGQNNSGKSNIIRYLHSHLEPLRAKLSSRPNNDAIFSDLDLPQNEKDVRYQIAFPLGKSDRAVKAYLNTKLPKPNQIQAQGLLMRLLDSDLFEQDDNDFWFVFESTDPNRDYKLKCDPVRIKELLSSNEIQNLWGLMTGQSGGGIDGHWIPQVIAALPLLPPTIPKSEIIPAIRNIGHPGSEAHDFSGLGIIERLARLQNPGVTNRPDTRKFERINNFLRIVTQKPDAHLEIPYERDAILVHMDNRILPLNSLGTGIHEVVILAAASTLLEDTIVCIEEPELHLHPTLQRRLVDHIAMESSNQYIFSTHSGHLLDTPDASIFHVRQLAHSAAVEVINSKKTRSNACHDLGLRASDVVQANCAIWVEGPSDRIYIKYWLRSTRPDLVEGIHYSIMFFGGKLFAHLSASDRDDFDSEVVDFVSVLELNRWSTIVFDSDKQKPATRLSNTKKRLQREFEVGKGFAWITNGREIENYLPSTSLKKCIESIHKGSVPEEGMGDKYRNALSFKYRGEMRVANKVKVARKYTSEYEADLSVLDLRKRLKQTVKFICDANGIAVDTFFPE